MTLNDPPTHRTCCCCLSMLEIISLSLSSREAEASRPLLRLGRGTKMCWRMSSDMAVCGAVGVVLQMSLVAMMAQSVTLR